MSRLLQALVGIWVVELLLLPSLKTGIAVIARKDPTEDTESRLLAPAVRVALACDHPNRFLRPPDQTEDDVSKRQGENNPLHHSERRFAGFGRQRFKILQQPGTRPGTGYSCQEAGVMTKGAEGASSATNLRRRRKHRTLRGDSASCREDRLVSRHDGEWPLGRGRRTQAGRTAW